MCQSFHDITRGIIQELVAELRRINPRRENGDYVADDEAEHNTPRRRLFKPRAKYPGVKRRSAAENATSVVTLFSRFLFTEISFQKRVREHMKVLIPQEDWLQNVISVEELNAWNHQAGPCCTSATFKLNLGGTPLDDWNLSASRVFTDHFLATHSALYTETWENREMVLKKSQAYIKTLIRLYRRRFVGDGVTLQTKLAHRRRQRKSDVSDLHPTIINAT